MTLGKMLAHFPPLQNNASPSNEWGLVVHCMGSALLGGGDQQMPVLSHEQCHLAIKSRVRSRILFPDSQTVCVCVCKRAVGAEKYLFL